MTNMQPPEKAAEGNPGEIDVHSIFYTIQGEGPLVGVPAVFVRLAGCNLQCPGCDTDYTNGRHTMSFASIVEGIADVSAPQRSPRTLDYPLVVISGGEPFRQRVVFGLIAHLINHGHRVQVETNGTLGPTTPTQEHALRAWTRRKQLLIVCSPKAGRINRELQPYICAYKYVLNADSVNADDGLPILALDHPAAPYVARPPLGSDVPVYVQPMDSRDPYKDKANLHATIESCMRYGYTLCLQTHKIIGLE